MANAVMNIPQVLLPGPRLPDGSDLNRAIANGLSASQDAIVALAGGGAAGAAPLGYGINFVKTAASGSDSVMLPPSVVGGSVRGKNNGAQTMTVYANTQSSLQTGVLDTINGTAGATGISVTSGSNFELNCTALGVWFGPVAMT